MNPNRSASADGASWRHPIWQRRRRRKEALGRDDFLPHLGRPRRLPPADELHSMLRIGRTVIVLLLGTAVIVGITGHAEFADAPSDALEKASAIVVLGGEHDGREQYALSLARRGFADTILMSDPYGSADSDMRRFCATKITGVEIICRQPSPSSTRGEAMLAGELGRARGWQRIIVISWQFHLPRARLVFAQCYSGGAGSVIFRAVPRRYDYSLLRWEYTYTYQYLAFAKAKLQGPCQQP